MNDAITAFEADDQARVAIITSSIEKAFSAGADLADLSRAMTVERLGHEEIVRSFGLTIANEGVVTKPLIAAISGHCVGEGFGLALHCDLRVAAENARFSLPEAKVGITTVRATIRLPQIIGLGNAFELLLAGVTKDAKWAERVGLVNAVVPYASLMDKAREYAELLAQASPRAVRNIKQLALASFSLPYDEAVALGLEMRRKTSRAQYAEGSASFIEKRKPEF